MAHSLSRGRTYDPRVRRRKHGNDDRAVRRGNAPRSLARDHRCRAHARRNRAADPRAAHGCGHRPVRDRSRGDRVRGAGAHRIINTLAASRLYKRDTIVVDLGTATTYDCITADGVFIGGVIAPGVRTSAETLFRRTSKLPATEIAPPARVIGRRTEECIRSGVVLGGAEAIDGLVRRIKGEWPGAAVPLVVATGGLATVFEPFCQEFEIIEPYLTLIGLRLAHE